MEYRVGTLMPVPLACFGIGGVSFSKRAAAALGMIPIAEGACCSPGCEVPIVYDLPAPDWPYARSETL